MSNPCPGATISGITFDPTSITVTDGSTATSEFVVPGDTVDSANSLTGLCGTKNYEIKNSSNTVITTWAKITDSTVTSGSKTLTIDPSVYGSHIASTVSETLTITTTYADWASNSGTTSTIAVTINPISCSCNSLAWTAPTAVTATVAINASGTPTVPAPVSDTSATSTDAAFSACYENSTPCATTGTYAASSIVLSDGSALPSWITWNDSSQTLTVAPTSVSDVGTTTLKGTYSPTYGTSAQFTVATLTIECIVSSFTRPSNPSTGLTYNLWSDSISFDFTQDWVQSPACGHTFTDSFTWSGLNSYIVQDSNISGRINVSSSKLAAVASYTVSVQNTVTIANNGSSGSTTFNPTDSSDKVEFTIVIANPCKTATVNTITVSSTDSSSPYSKSVTDGSTTTVTFVRPTTSVEDSSGIASVCGDTSYSLHSDNSGTAFTYNASWAVISGPVSNTYTLTIDTTADLSLIDNESSKTISVYIKATLDDYTSDNRESYTQVNIVINEVTCDCSALAWDDPTSGVTVSSTILAGTSASTQTLAVPVANTGARSTNAAYDKCYIDGDSGNDCATTGAYDSLTWDDGTGATTLPSWITFSSSGTTSQTVSINPTDGTVKGTHNLIAVFNPTNGLDKTFTALTFTVGCEITSFTVSGAPASNPTYNIWTQRSIINLTGMTYT